MAISFFVVSIAMITYFAVGSGNFLDTFLGIPAISGLSSEFWAATSKTVLAMIYTLASGFYGVVWTDLFQGVFILAVIVYTAVLVLPISVTEDFAISVPVRDEGLEPLQTIRVVWTSVIPRWKLDFPATSAYSICSLLGVAIFFSLLKVTIEGSGGASGFLTQRYYAARSDGEAGLVSLLWNLLLSFRWLFVAAIGALGISCEQVIV
ncbi:MAG: hypothetical protein ACUVTG_15675 [Candidatus Oleimicrobiaceae bacterium]